MNRAHASKTKTHIEGTGKHVQDGRRRRCATLRGGPSAKQSTRFGTAADTDQMSERVRRRMCIHILVCMRVYVSLRKAATAENIIVTGPDLNLTYKSKNKKAYIVITNK